MKLFDSKSSKFTSIILIILPITVMVFIGTTFYISVSKASTEALLKEQQNLEKTLQTDAINYYADNGQYPDSLDTLLSSYKINYNSSKFVIDYTPNGTNLLPSISVIVLSDSISARRDGENE